MPHIYFFLGGGIVINSKHVGPYCTCNINVLVGNKGDNTHLSTIGKNVTLAPGSKIIGEVYVGDNVFVAPNSVVIKDVPSNCAVAGIPARIIKKYE